MRRKPYTALLVFVLSLGLAGFAYVYVPPAAEPLDYLERTTHGADVHTPLPLVLAIHGRGGSPEEFARTFEQLDVPARLILPRGPERYGAGSQWYPLDRPLRRPTVIRTRADQLAKLIERVRRTRPTRGRAIVTGFSQGGVMSFALAAYHPALIESALPIAATLHPFLPAPVSAPHPPSLFAFHGREDPVMPLAEAERMVSAMRARGARTGFVSYKGLGHALADPMRAEVLAKLRALLRDASERE